MQAHTIRVKQVQPQRALTLRFTAQNHLHYAQAWNEIRTALRANSFQAADYPFQIIYADEYREDDIDTEIALPALDTWTAPVTLASFGVMTVRELPGGIMASYPHVGDPKLLMESQIDMQAWAAEQGYKLGGSMRVIYQRGLVVPMPIDQWMVEVQHLIEPITLLQ